MTTSGTSVEAIVYKATNLVNGRSYIGATNKGLPQRERQHRRTADRGEGWRLHNAIRKYGHDSIVFEQLASFGDDYELALAYEHEYIAKHQPAYNIAAGGEGRSGPMSPEGKASFRAKRAGKPSYRKGIPLTEEHKQKISAANKGQGLGRKGPPLSEEHKQRLREANLGKRRPGRIVSEETKARMREGNAKRQRPYPTHAVTEETRKKISAANKGQIPWTKGRVMSEEFRQKQSDVRRGVRLEMTPARVAALAASIKKAQAANVKQVVCVTTGEVFVSASEAAVRYGTTAKLLRQCILRGHKVSGHVFSYYTGEGEV